MRLHVNALISQFSESVLRRCATFTAVVVLLLLTQPLEVHAANAVDTAIRGNGSDYLNDPIREGYRPRLPYPEINLTAGSMQFVPAGVTPTEENTQALIRIKLKDGRRLDVADGVATGFRSTAGGEFGSDLVQLRDLYPSVQWVAAANAPEDRVVAMWKTAEAYWKERLPDPRSLYYVVASKEEKDEVALALSRMPVVEYVDIVDYTTRAAGDGMPPLDISSNAAGPVSTADLSPQWFRDMQFDAVHRDLGVVGFGSSLALGTQGRPTGGPGYPAPADWSSFGPHGPHANDNFTHALAAFALPKATLGCVRVAAQGDPSIPDFAGGLMALSNLMGSGSLTGPMVYASDYAMVFRGGPFNGISVPMEWDKLTYDAIRLINGNGVPVMVWSGASHIDLADATKYPPTPHKPFSLDPLHYSGATIVATRDPRSNVGNRIDFIPDSADPAAHYGASTLIGTTAALVHSAMQVAGDSVPPGPTIGSNRTWRSLPLGRAYDAIREILNAALPNPTLRVQDNPPSYQVFVLNQSKALPNIPGKHTREELIRVFNDGKAAMSFSASVFTEGPSGGNSACSVSPALASILGGKAVELKLSITPQVAGKYVCHLFLDTNDPRTQMPVSPADPTKRRWSMKFTFESDIFPGAQMRVRDLVDNPVSSGHLFDFGTLAADEAGPFSKWPLARQAKAFIVRNENWADTPLQINLPAVPNDDNTTHKEPRLYIATPQEFLFKTPGYPARTITIPAGEERTFFVVANQTIIFTNLNEETFARQLTFTTNDANVKTFNLQAKVKLRKDEDLFELRHPNEYVLFVPDSWASIDLGAVDVSEVGLWTLKRWGAFRAVVDSLLVEWKEDTSPFDSGRGLLDKDAKTLGKIVPVEAILDTTKIVDFVLQRTVSPPPVGRVSHRAVLKVKPPGGPENTYYVYLEGTVKGNGPAKLSVHTKGAPPLLQFGSVSTMGTSSSGVIAVDGTLDFRVELGASLQKEITLENTGTTAMTVRGLWVDHHSYTVELPDTTIPPKSYVPMRITLIGQRRGPAVGRLSFYIDGTGETDNFFTMNLAGEVCSGTNCASSIPVINSFQADPLRIEKGQSTTLKWDVSNSTSVGIADNVSTVTVSATGSRSVRPTSDTTYTLVAKNGAETTTRSTTVTVIGDGPPGSPVISDFTATPRAIEPGQSTKLTWSVTGATSLSIEPIGTVTGTEKIVTPSDDITYILIATNSVGTSRRMIDVVVGAGPGKPVINTFTVNPEVLAAAGMSTVITWSVGNAESVEISPEIGVVLLSGTRTLSPTVTTQYTLRARNSNGETSQSRIVTVPGTSPGGIPPTIKSFTASSTSAAAGQPVTMSWEVEGADTVILAPPLTPVDAAGSRPVQSQGTTTYMLFARNSAGSVAQELTIAITGGPAVPSIQEFSVVPTPVVVGGGGELRWTTANAQTANISPDIGTVAPNGVKSIKPGIDTLYVLTALNASGSASRAVAVPTTPATQKPLTKPVELLRGTDVATGVRLEESGTTNLYDPIRGYSAGSMPMLIVNRSSKDVTIARLILQNYWGGSPLFSLSSDLRGVTLKPNQSVPVTVRWDAPVAPRGYEAYLQVAVDGTSVFHEFQFAIPEWKPGASSIPVDVTDVNNATLSHNYPTAPFVFAPTDGLDVGLASTDAIAQKSFRIHNKGGSAVTVVQGWCGGDKFTMFPAAGTYPIDIAPNSFATFQVKGVNLHKAESDNCFSQVQSSGDEPTAGKFVALRVNATGTNGAPWPVVFDPKFKFVDDFGTNSNAKPYALKLRPGRTTTLTFTVKNAGGSPYTDLRLRTGIQVSGDGFRLKKGYHATSGTILPLLTVGAPLRDAAALQIEFVGRPAGVYPAVIRLPMWAGESEQPPFEWERTFEFHILVVVGSKRARVTQGEAEIDNGGGFDADETTSFTVENTSSTPLNLSGLAVPPHYKVTSALPKSLAAGERGMFVIRQTGPPAPEADHFVSFDVDDPDDPLFQMRENHKPIAVTDSDQVEPDGSVVLDVTANDTDVDGDGLSLSEIPVVVPPTKGVVTPGLENTLIYAPNAGVTGNDRFTYEINDGRGGVARGVAHVNIGIPNRAPLPQPDSATTKPGRAVTIAVTSNDTDPDGDPVVLAAVTGAPLHGTARKLTGTNNVEYTPTAGFVGTDTFTYQAEDTYGKGAQAVVTIEVMSTTPVAKPDSVDTKPGREVRIRVTDNDVDEDGDAVVLIANPIVDAPNGGTAVKIDNATIEYTPTGSFSGVDLFTYQIAGATGPDARAVVTVRVQNSLATAVNDAVQTTKNKPITINVLANDSDPDGDTIWLTQKGVTSQPLHGTASRIDNEQVSYAPAATFVGTDTFTYEVTDNFWGKSTGTVTVTVINTLPPVARNDHAKTRRDTPITIDVLDNDSDPDGQIFTLTNSPIKSQPRHGTVDRTSNRTITYTPELNWAGNDIFEYEIADGSGNKDRAWVAVHVGRTKGLPVAVDDDVITAANQGVTIDVTANDGPAGTVVFLTEKPIFQKPQRGAAARVSDSQLSYAPNSNYTGQDTFAYEISDSEGATVIAFVNVTVIQENRAPTAYDDGTIATGVGKAVTIDVVGNDKDLDNDTLVLIGEPVIDGPANGKTSRASAQQITYTPNPGFSGEDTFKYRITDGREGYAEASVKVSVSDANHPPIAEDDTATTSAGTAVTINVIANDSDGEGERVTLSSVVGTVPNGTAVKVSDTSITYTPKAGFSGVDRFQYEAKDASGLPDTAFVDVTVGGTTPANQNPVAVDDAVTIKENTSVDIIVTANDSDPDGDTLMLTTNFQRAGPFFGALTKLSNTKIRYTPNTDFVGVDSVHYEITDGKEKKARAWVNITVRNANSQPVAVDDIASTNAGAPVTINVIKNDSDPDGDQVRLRAGDEAIDTPAGHGTLLRIDDASIKYTPAAGFSGTDRFRYAIRDGRGGGHKAWVNVTVASGASAGLTTMSAAGLPPVANNDSAESLMQTAVPVVVLTNDISVKGYAVMLAASPVITPPLYGSVARESDTVLTYTPGAGFRGNDRFEYEVVDTAGQKTQAWVTVQIPGDNQPPVAVADTVAAALGSAVIIGALANDSDADGDPIALTPRAITIEPLHGTVRRHSDTELKYEPFPEFVGADTFTYEITDQRGGIAEAKVVINVSNGSLPPVAADDAVTIESGQSVTINVLGNDSDPEGEKIRIVSSVPPTKGSLVWNANGTAAYQSNVPSSGTDTFRYTLQDPHGLQDEAVVTITITVPNRAPVIANDTAQTTTRTPVLIGVLGNDYDPEYLKLKVVSVTQPARGTVAVNNMQSVTYTPANDFAGTDTFTYNASDGKTPVKGTVTVTVVNRPPAPRSEILSAREDQATPFYASVNLLNNDTDPDGDELKVTLYEQPQNGTFQIAADLSMVAYTPKANWSGMDSFHYTVADPFGASVRVMSQISVSAVNDAPVAVNDSFTMYNNQILTLTQAQVVGNDTDLEGHTITIYSVGTPANGTAQKLADGSIRYEPHGGFAGTDTFTYRIEDSGGGAYGDGVITVTVVADARPVANFTFSCTYLVCSFDASSATDDRGITSYQWTLGDGRAASGKTFSHTYSGAGSYTARLTVYDVLGQTGTMSKSVTVAAPPNTPPTAMKDTFSGFEDQTIGIYGSTLLSNDTDAEGNTPLRITAVTLPAKGTLTYPADFSSFVYKSNANWFGSDSFTYTVSDSLGMTSQGTVLLTVNSVNDAPVAVNDSFSVYKNQLLTITQAQLAGNDTDIENQTITVYAVGAPANGTAVKLAGGSVEYRPHGQFVGADSFEYTIQDSGGAYGSGRVNVNVLQDTPPVASYTYSCTHLACSFNASASTDDRGIITYQWTLGNNTSAAGQTFNYTYGAAGSYTVKLTVTDAIGQTGVQSKVVVVTQPNAPPAAATDSFSGPEDGTISLNGSQLLANDSDSDGHTPLRITAVTLPANGTLTYPADFSSFSFRSNANWFGTSSFTYTVADSLGATAQGTVQLTVNSVNDAPVAGTDSFTVYKNQLLTITPAQLLANDSDLEGHVIYVSAAGPATNGTVQRLANENIEYRPYGEFVGADSFDYTLRDSFGATASGRVNITVLQDTPPVANFTVTCNGRVCSFDASSTTDDRGITSYQWTLGNNSSANGKTFTYTYAAAGTYQVRLTVWDAMGQTSIAVKWATATEPLPDAVNDLFSFSKGYARSIAYVDMLRNDTDPNGDVLSVISTDSSQTTGTLTCDSTSCVFQPFSQYWYGQTTFTYTISDGHGKTDTATVTIDFRY